MKTHLATAEICKMYVEGYAIDTILLQKELPTRNEAKKWLKEVEKRVNANKGKVSLNYTHIQLY